MNKEIYVYADWVEIDGPLLIGILHTDYIRGAEHFSFSYSKVWLKSVPSHPIDLDLHLYPGRQHSANKYNFRVFLDSCPDRWGRLLMQRREAVIARQEGRSVRILRESDYLLGVHDSFRMGGLRFKQSPEGNFLDDRRNLLAPPITSLPELAHAALMLGKADNNIDNPEYLRWLNMLISPGSSLGGARPKAVVLDNSCLWIAKFPSMNDEVDVAAWEYVAYKLAVDAGISMAESRLAKLKGPHHTFLTRRFDRSTKGRRHFTSAMTQLGFYDGQSGASYIDIAEHLVKNGSSTKKDLAELWRRIIFNIAISNTDDHLRNHGFIYHSNGWILSPAYDLNPTVGTLGLHLNISDTDNSLNYDLAMEVREYFRLNRATALQIKSQVLNSVARWAVIAEQTGISHAERQLMEPAFNI